VTENRGRLASIFKDCILRVVGLADSSSSIRNHFSISSRYLCTTQRATLATIANVEITTIVLPEKTRGRRKPEVNYILKTPAKCL